MMGLGCANLWRRRILDKGTVGENYIVEKMNLPQQVEHRLEALGMTLGTRVSVLGSKDKGTLILKVRGTRFAMGRGITGRIEVV